MKNARRLLERLYGSDCSFISNTVNEFNAMMLTAARLQ
jgi:hypothetical protein